MVDAGQRELAARLEVVANHRLAVVVADAAAVYPVRIDPTFSDANWSALGSGMDNEVYALAVSGTDLYAGGWFTTAGGVSANYIAKWDGSAWSALGSGMDNGVNALAMSATDLYAGGQFTTAGGKVSANVAKALLPVDTTTTVDSSANPSTYGASVTFTATASPSAASGTVTFKDGATALATGSLSGGTATFSTSALNAGSHNITAEYAGDVKYNASTSSPLS